MAHELLVQREAVEPRYIPPDRPPHPPCIDGSYDHEEHIHNNYNEPEYKAWYFVTLVMCILGLIGHMTVAFTILSDRHYRRHLCYLMVLGQVKPRDVA